MGIFKLMTLGALVACTAGATRESPAPGGLNWLAGHWCFEKGGEFVEEHWLPPRGDLLLGVGRTVERGKTLAFEFLRIEQGAGGTNYIAQPQGGTPTTFRLAASGADWARFENPQHDFPKRVEYRRTPDGMHAEIAGPGTNGKETVIPFEYRDCQDRRKTSAPAS